MSIDDIVERLLTFSTTRDTNCNTFKGYSKFLQTDISKYKFEFPLSYTNNINYLLTKRIPLSEDNNIVIMPLIMNTNLGIINSLKLKKKTFISAYSKYFTLHVSHSNNIYPFIIDNDIYYIGKGMVFDYNFNLLFIINIEYIKTSYDTYKYNSINVYLSTDVFIDKVNKVYKGIKKLLFNIINDKSISIGNTNYTFIENECYSKIPVKLIVKDINDMVYTSANIDNVEDEDKLNDDLNDILNDKSDMILLNNILDY